MLRHLLKFYTLFLLIPVLTVQAQTGTPGDKPLVYLFNIDEGIFPPAVRKLTSAMEEARSLNADVIVLRLNTYGGAVDAMDEMRVPLLEAEEKTICFVTDNAASAGALIALSCDSIYMNYGATIGAATVVDETGTAAPDKYQSYYRKKFRSTAERNGRDPDIAEGMVDENVEIDGITVKGQVITFTSEEALRHDYADGLASTVEEALAMAGIEDYELVEYEPSWIDKAISWFTHPAVSGILMTIMFFGIFFELQTPGVGFPLIGAVTAAILFFSPLYLDGLAQEWEILLFIIGFGLLAVEIFALPGFGVAGFSGITLILGALILSLIGNVYFDFTWIGFGEIGSSFFVVTMAMMATIGLLMLFGKKFYSSPLTRALIFSDTLDSEAGNQVDTFRGSDLLNKTGKAVTDLRPAGKVEIGDERYDAYTAGEWIEQGEEIIVLRAKGISLIVQKTDETEKA